MPDQSGAKINFLAQALRVLTRMLSGHQDKSGTAYPGPNDDSLGLHFRGRMNYEIGNDNRISGSTEENLRKLSIIPRPGPHKTTSRRAR